jgi:hypothetical protein
MLLLHQSTVHLPDPQLGPHDNILHNNKYYPYFKDCLGALDGTHIPIHVAAVDRIPYRNRHKTLSQNVLAVCDFGMLFCFVLAGWEGSAYDSRVLTDARYRHDFKIPAGKYYLGDAGYANSSTLLTPYRGVRYHLNEYLAGNQRPQTPQELFNLRHSTLRNVIERIFGVMKRRFQVLNLAARYPVDTQVWLVYALTELHNFITEHQTAEDVDILASLPDRNPPVIERLPEVEEIVPCTSVAGRNAMDALRDRIADDMWEDYLRYGDSSSDEDLGNDHETEL